MKYKLKISPYHNNNYKCLILYVIKTNSVNKKTLQINFKTSLIYLDQWVESTSSPVKYDYNLFTSLNKPYFSNPTLHRKRVPLI